MEKKRLRKILEKVSSGDLSVTEGVESLKHLPYENMGFARVDHHRELRHGVPEVIFAEGKTRENVKEIARSMLEKNGKFLITRGSKENYEDISDLCGKGNRKVVFFENSGVIMTGQSEKKKGRIVILTAGTSDVPVAEEALATATFLGSRVEEIYDVGVAGLHRLFEAGKTLSKARVIIVVAGMEGALPSVIGGMTDRTIIAVPTSVGYGTSLGGLTALFAMLNSCVPGIAVMNIDNGFGAGVLAHKINTLKVP